MPATTLAPTPAVPAAPAQTPLPGDAATSPPAASFEPVLAEAARSLAASDSEDAVAAASVGTTPSAGEADADVSAPAEGRELDTPATPPSLAAAAVPGAPAVEAASEPAAPTPGRAPEVVGQSETTPSSATTAAIPSNLAGTVPAASETFSTPGQPAGESVAAATGTGARTPGEQPPGAAGAGAPGVPLPPAGPAQAAPAPVEPAPVEGVVPSRPRTISPDDGDAPTGTPGAPAGTPGAPAGQGVSLPGPAATSTAAATVGRATGIGGGAGAEPTAHTSRSGQAHAEAQTAATTAAPAQPVDRIALAPPPEIPRARTTLAALADTTHSLIRMAARDGHARALITLRPAELGHVEIRLRFHDGRLTADVVAESRQAADVLLQASGDLRRSLESQGLTLHALDVRDGSAERGTRDHPHDPARGGVLARHEQGDDQSTTIEASSLPLPEGMLDVLA